MKADDAKRWLDYAETDLRAAHALLESGEFFPRQICFLSQQCGEKAIKAILVFEEVNFPKNHDLDRLRDLIPDGWKFKETFPDLAELTIWWSSRATPVIRPTLWNTKRARRSILQNRSSIPSKPNWKQNCNSPRPLP